VKAAVEWAHGAGRKVAAHVLTKKSAALAVAAGVDSAPVREVMTPSVIAVPPDATARDVSETMAQHMVRRVFVADADRIPVGVVSTTDLFRGLLSVWGEMSSPALAS
jgi:CBS domain-containing protein